MNKFYYFLNKLDFIMLNDDLLSHESIQLLRDKYKIQDSNLLKKIKKCCQTDNTFSLLTIDNDLISFSKSKIYNTHNLNNIYKLENIISNSKNFCGITTNNKIIFWGDIFKVSTLYYNIDKNICKIFPLSNGFLIYSHPNIYLWENLNVTKMLKNVEWMIDVSEKFQLFKKCERIYFIDGDVNKKFICNMSTENEKLNLVKILIINKLINNKNRLIQIVDYCIKNISKY